MHSQSIGQLDAMTTNEYRLEEINQAFDDLEKRRAGRALIRLSGGPV